MVVTTDGMERSLFLLSVEMLDSGTPGWVGRGETLLFTDDGGCDWFDGGAGGGTSEVWDAMYALNWWLFSCMAVWMANCMSSSA